MNFKIFYFLYTIFLLKSLVIGEEFPLNLSKALESNDPHLLADYVTKWNDSWKKENLSNISENDKAEIFQYCYEYLKVFPWESYLPPEKKLITDINAVDSSQLTRPALCTMILAYAYTSGQQYGLEYDKFLQQKSADYPGKWLFLSWRKYCDNIQKDITQAKMREIMNKSQEEQKIYLTEILEKLKKDKSIHDPAAELYLIYLANTSQINTLVKNDSAYADFILSMIETLFPFLPVSCENVNFSIKQIMIALYIKLSDPLKARKWIQNISRDPDDQHLTSKEKRFIRNQLLLLQ